MSRTLTIVFALTIAAGTAMLLCASCHRNSSAWANAMNAATLPSPAGLPHCEQSPCHLNTAHVQNTLSSWMGRIYECCDTDEAREQYASAVTFCTEHLQPQEADACIAMFSWIMLLRPDGESMRLSVWNWAAHLRRWPDWLLEVVRRSAGYDSMDDIALFSAIANSSSTSASLSAWAFQYLERFAPSDPTLAVRAYRIALAGGFRDARWDSVVRQVANGRWGDDRSIAFELLCKYDIPLSNP